MYHWFLKLFINFGSHNACSHVIRHWENPLVEPAAHGETKGFSLSRPHPFRTAKLANYVCLVQANSVLDLRKPRGQILFF